MRERNEILDGMMKLVEQAEKRGITVDVTVTTIFIPTIIDILLDIRDELANKQSSITQHHNGGREHE